MTSFLFVVRRSDSNPLVAAHDWCRSAIKTEKWGQTRNSLWPRDLHSVWFLPWRTTHNDGMQLYSGKCLFTQRYLHRSELQWFSFRILLSTKIAGRQFEYDCGSLVSYQCHRRALWKYDDAVCHTVCSQAKEVSLRSQSLQWDKTSRRHSFISFALIWLWWWTQIFSGWLSWSDF